MNFFSGFFKGIVNSFKSFTVLFEKGLWPFLLYGFGIWLITFLLTLFGVTLLADYVSKELSAWLSFESIPEEGHWLSWAKSFLTGYFSFLIAVVLKMVLWFTTATLSKYIGLIILSPLFAILSEKTEEKLTGTSFPFSFSQLMKDILRGIIISLRNMFFEYLFIILGLLINLFLPVSVFVTTPVVLFISWYYTGFTMLDYNSERHKYGVGQSVNFVRSNKGYVCGIGFVYWLVTFIPILGITFGPVMAVIGGTMSFLALTGRMKN
jgi:CysZ protein